MLKTLELYDKQEFFRCLQCAVCTGSCPTARVVDGFNPREFVLRFLFSDDMFQLDTDVIWACTTCQICRERCPHDIDIMGMLIHIMNQLARQGRLPKMLHDSIKMIMKTGWSVPITPRVDRAREELGLSPLRQPDVEEINQILLESGIGDILS